MDIPTEIFHEILSHLPIIDISRVENALDIIVPNYLYLQIHKKNFKSSLDEINCIGYEVGSTMDKVTTVSVRKFGKIADDTWACVHVYHNRAHTYDITSFRTHKSYSNTLITFTPKLSIAFTKCIYNAERLLHTVRLTDSGLSMSLMIKGDKSAFGIGDVGNDFVYSSYGVVFFENNIF